MLTGAEAFVASATGFATPLGNDPAAAVGRRGGLSAALPRRAEDPVRFHLLGGMQIGVREVGASGEGSLAEGAVAYPRKGGTSFWTATAEGYEEWLHLGRGVATGREPVASWEVEGASLREANGAIEIAGADGDAQVWVRAPVAFAEGGRPVPTRLAANGTRIELWADAGGEAVLVDPVWTTASPMGTSRYGHTAVVLESGRVLVAGGCNGGSYLTSAEEYDPVTGAWESVGSMGAARFYAAAVRLTNGKVLVAGGAYLNSAELYDPATRTWQSTGAMSKARAYHAAVAVPVGAGKALVAGGYNPGDGYLNGAEIYDSATGNWSPAGPAGMSVARVGNTADWLGGVGKVLVAGGYTGTVYTTTAELYDPGTDTWATTGSMNVAHVYHATAVLANGKVLVAGGGVNSAELYDPTAGTWAATGSMSNDRSYFTATRLSSGKVLVAGGWSSAAWAAMETTQTYDPETGAWTSSGSMSTARYYHTASLLGSGEVLVAGGYVGGAVLSAAELYDPVADSWTSVGALSTSRRYHTAAPLGDGSVLVAGGLTATGVTANAQAFDPSTGVWSTSIAAMHYERQKHTATGLGSGKILVAGGQGNSSVYQLVTELYDPSSNAWTTSGSLSTGRYWHTATLLGSGKVLVVGGANGGGSISSVELYDPAGGTWTGKPPLPTPRERHTATLLWDGRVLVAGGYSGGTDLATAELYDPDADTWSSAAPMSAARRTHTAVLLLDGRVLVAGGQSGTTYLASAEIYDPATNTWSAATSMSAGRRSHTMTMLNDGKAVVAGGYAIVSGTARFLQGVEIYDPGAGTWSTAAQMSVGRENHTATALGNGTFLVVGGDNSSGTIASAEVYTPVIIDDHNPCTVDAWSPSVKQVTHTPVANGSLCDGVDRCYQTYTCQNGACVGTNPVVCTPDQCHDAMCFPMSGTCITWQSKPDGTACDDGNACTQNDTCQLGICNGSPVECTAPDQCHDAGSCNPTTGACSAPVVKSDGTACEDGNHCTLGDTCQAGVCTSGNPRTCPAPDQCYTEGTCDPATGYCSMPQKPNGTACKVHNNACTQGDTCQEGLCISGSPVVCPTPDQCHNPGTCDTSTGVCSNPAKADGTGCNDGNACTQTDTCQAGTCTGSNPIVCTALDQCHDVGTCNTSTGVCPNPSKADGTSCSDGNACTQTDTCQAGICTSGTPIVCTAPHAHEQCANGVCVLQSCAAGWADCDGNPANGCEVQPAVDAANCGACGNACASATACTPAATCQAGACQARSSLPAGTPCSDSNPCNGFETCDGSGVCLSGPAASLDDGDLCTPEMGVIKGPGDVACAPFDPATSPLPAPQAIVAPEPAGTIPGAFAVSQTGQATYTIPLVVPPGRAGMQPRLSLAYDSSVGQGLAGVGFGLRGFSVISRCGSTLARNGVIRGVQYDTGDNLCLDGALLVLAQEAPGVIEYRTLPDTFSKILAYYPEDWNRERGPASFQVFTKDGRILTYGGATSRAMAKQGTIASWWVSREEDRRGNAIEYTYHNDTHPTEGYTVEHYPDEIHYTSTATEPANRKVHFDYAASMLPRAFYVGGMERRHDHLLEKVKMYGPDDVLVRTYLLNYNAGTATLKPRLVALQEYAQDVFKPATWFDWSSDESTAFTRIETQAVADPTTVTVPYGTRWWTMADVTGDGLADLVVSRMIENFTTDDTNVWEVSTNVQTAAVFPTRTMWSSDYAPVCATCARGNAWRGIPFDYDMDGRKDFLVEPTEAPGISTYQVLRSRPGGGFDTIDTGITHPTLPYVDEQRMAVLLADLNGDGAADLIECDNPGFQNEDPAPTARWTVRFWSPAGPGFESEAAPIPPLDGRQCRLAPAFQFPDPFVHGLKLVDLDADGKMDLLVAKRGTANAYESGDIPECTSNCTYRKISYLGPGLWSDTDTGLPTATADGNPAVLTFPDVNGDGLPDAVWQRVVAETYRDINVSINTGAGFAPSVVGVPGQDAYYMSFRHATLIDYNGDGAIDILIPRRGDASTKCPFGDFQHYCWSVLRSRHDAPGTFVIVDTDIVAEIDFLGRPVGGLQVADIDGDGRHDFVISDHDTFVAYKGNGPRDLLLAITDGMNPLDHKASGSVPTVSIEYGNLIDLARTSDISPDSATYDNLLYVASFDAGNDCAFPRSCVAGARRVVSKYMRNNGLNQMRTFSMHYRDGRADHLLGGFVGFGARFMIDENTGAGAAEFYDNATYNEQYAAYPFAGIAERTWAWSAGDIGPIELTYTGSHLTVVPSPAAAQTFFVMPMARSVEREQGQFAATSTQTYFGYVRYTETHPATVLSQSWRLMADWDAYGNVLEEVDWTDGVDDRTQITRTFSNDADTWLIKKLDSEQACSTAAGETKCRQTKLQRNAYGEVRREAIGDDTNPETKVTRWYGRDVYGNVTGVLADDAFGHHRSMCVSYDRDNIFPYQTRNAAGHTTYTQFDPGLGVMTAIIDENGLLTQRSYDGFGRVVAEVGPETTTTVSHQRVKTGGPQGNWYALRTLVVETGHGAQTIERDSLGRVVHTWTRGPEVQACGAAGCVDAATDWDVEQETEYDPFGRVRRVSIPWMTGEPASARRYHWFDYDSANRVYHHSTPWNSVITHAYGPNTSSVTDSAGTTTVEVDALRRPLTVTDKLGNITTYGYGPFGGLRVVDNMGEQTITERDAYGRVQWSKDPNRGESTMTYDGYGDVTSVTDAIPREASFEYDALGRLRSRSDGEGITTWAYDSAAHGKGKLARVTSPAGHVKEYSYDSHARPASMELTIDGESFSTTFTYDPWGRLYKTRYPGPSSLPYFEVVREYDTYGNVIRVHDNVGSPDQWRLDAVDSAGRPTHETFGNGAVSRRSYLQDKGTIRSIDTDIATPNQGTTKLQSLWYTYDDRLNVLSRLDALQPASALTAMAEVFSYDSLDRLTCAQFTEAPVIDGTPPANIPYPAGNCAHETLYQPNGNMQWKTGVGSYEYNNPAHPHAVTTAGTDTFEYDAVGNQTKRPGASIHYTSFDLPSTVDVTADGTVISFDYDGDQQRIRKTTPAEETVYVDGLYERVTDQLTAEVQHRYYVAVGSATLVVTRADGQAEKSAYVYPDALGSPDVIVTRDALSKVQTIERRSHDAFGARRNPDWTQNAQGTYPKGVNIGFTGHEPDDELGLVNMRGRIYDPKIARFLQTDPIVSRPLFSQRWNAYSYVLNNPLRWVDPTGFDDDGTLQQDTTNDNGKREIVFSDATIIVDPPDVTVDQFSKPETPASVSVSQERLKADNPSPVAALDSVVVNDVAGEGGAPNVTWEEFRDSLREKGFPESLWNAPQKPAPGASAWEYTVAVYDHWAYYLGMPRAYELSRPVFNNGDLNPDDLHMMPLAVPVPAVGAIRLPGASAEAAAAKSAARLSPSVKEFGKCREFAARLQGALTRKGISGTRIRIERQGARIGDIRGSGTLVGDDVHEAIRVGDKVFDNLNPGGVPYELWRNSMRFLSDVGIRIADEFVKETRF